MLMDGLDQRYNRLEIYASLGKDIDIKISNWKGIGTKH